MSKSAERLSLPSAAFVIARRDFLAVLLSKAFLFFLLGPLLFLGISILSASLGTRAAESAAPPTLATTFSPEESLALVEAHERLSDLIPMPDLDMTTRDHMARPAALLADPSRNVAAVLTGSLDAPRLVGPAERIESWQGAIAIAIADSRGRQTGRPTVALDPVESSAANARRAQTATATAGVVLLFLLTTLLATMVLSNLVEEKANKIIEILAAAIPMDAVFLGKLFAMLGVSFVGIAVWGSIGAAIIAAGGGAIELPPPPAIGWPLFIALFLIYFAMTYLLVGSIFLTVGAMAPTVRDVQTLSMPATMVQLGVFFLGSFAVSDTGSAVELFAVAFPLSSPYAMVGRAAQFDTLWWHAAAIGWQAFWVAVFVRFGANLFKRKAMQSGPARGKSLMARLKGA